MPCHPWTHIKARKNRYSEQKLPVSDYDPLDAWLPRIAHLTFPFSITDFDLELIACSRPKLRTLMLSEYYTSAPATLSCPNLVNLDLFLIVSLPFQL